MKNSKQLYFKMPNKKALGIEDYIITDSNNFAFDLIVKILKGETDFGLISGPPYSGKTHLSKILIKNARNYKTLYFDRDYQNILDRLETSDIDLPIMLVVTVGSSKESLVNVAKAGAVRYKRQINSNDQPTDCLAALTEAVVK